MKLILYYSDLSRAADNSNKLASELDDYCDSLSKKVQKKMYSVEGGMSSALNTADYYVNQKIRNLRTKSSNARNLARQINNLLGTAKRVDSDVKSTIEANQKNLFQKHADLRPSNAQLYLTSFLCDAKNKPIIGSLIREGEAIGNGINHLKKEIRYWYKCEGGKELVGIILSAVGAVLAVVVLVAAFAFTGGSILAVIAGVAGIIGAMIGLANAVTNVFTSFQAYESATGGHPGQAKIYAGQDKFSDVLRDTNFHNKDWNRGSNIAATSLDVTEMVCDIIGIINGINNASATLKKSNLKKTFYSIFRPKEGGRFAPGNITPKSFWEGLKSITCKINAKDMLLGDLNVKNLSRLSLLDTRTAIESIGNLGKAAQKLIGDLDKINEGNMTLKELIAKRILIGLDKSMFGQETWGAKEYEGNGFFHRKGDLYSTYSKNNFSKIIGSIRDHIDKLGISRILIKLPKNTGISNVVSPPSGLFDKICDLLDRWLPPSIEFDSSMGAWNSMQGYSNVQVRRQEPIIKVNPVPPAPSYIMPSMRLNLSIQYRYPYLDIAV